MLGKVHTQRFIPASISVFNGDLVFAELVNKYPHIEPIRLQGGVAVALEKVRDEALAAKKALLLKASIRQTWQAK